MKPLEIFLELAEGGATQLESIDKVDDEIINEDYYIKLK